MKNENLENAVESTETIVVEEAYNNQNVIKKVALGLGVVGLGIGIFLYLKKRKNAKKEELVICEEVVSEDEPKVEEKKSSKK